MKPSTLIDTRVETNFVPADKIEMGIDEVDFGHLMSVLTNLYSDPEMAVLREYSTNARDAHIMAGQTRPIEVTLPSRLSTYLRIQDFGVGLDLDDIRNIYSKYGKSTKRGDNSQNGMLGLGSKSALTYTSQFSVTSVKDGKCYVVSVSLNERHRGEMNVVSVYDTTEPNGVTIEIPAKRTHSFHEKASHLFRFWEPGTVLVDGKQPPSVLENGTKVTDEIYQVDGLSTDYLVLAGVGYPVKEEYHFFKQDSYYRQFGVVYFVKPDKDGSPIEHTPNREALFYTPRTIATIQKAQKVFNDKFKETVQANVEAAENAYQAILLAHQWNTRYRTVKFDALTYRGQVIPTVIMCPEHEEEFTTRLGVKDKRKVSDPWYYYLTNRSGRGSTGELSAINGMSQRYVLVTGYDFKTVPSTTVRAKVRQWQEDNSDTSSAFLFVKTHPDRFWLGDWKVVPYSEIKATKLPVQKRAATFKFPLLTDEGTWVDSSIDFDKEKVLYISPTEVAGNSYSRARYGNASHKALFKAMAEHGYKVILLNANRHAKFRRDYGCKTLREVGQEIVKAYRDSLTKDELLLMSYQESDLTLAQDLVKHARVDVLDPDVVSLAKVDRDRRRTLLSKRESMVNFARIAGGSGYLPNAGDRVSLEFKKYPLISSLRDRSYRSFGQTECAELVTYMNARYKEGF